MNMVRRNEKQFSAIVYTQATTGNMSMLLRELLRQYRWTVVETTDSVETIIRAVEKGEASLIIVDDAPEMPSTSIVRKLMISPVCIATPTLCFASEDTPSEKIALSHMGPIAITPKPLTPDKFLPSFKELVKRWEGGYYALLRQAIDQILKGRHETGLRMLTKLNEHAGARPIVASVLAHYYRYTDNQQTAEKVLLTALRDAPRHLGLIFALSDLYMSSSMPMMAFRLLAGAKTAYGSCTAILVDLVQSTMMLQNLDEAIKFLIELHNRKYMPQNTAHILIRLLYSQGRHEEISKFVSRHSVVAKLEASWNAEGAQPPATPAAAS